MTKIQSKPKVVFFMSLILSAIFTLAGCSNGANTTIDSQGSGSANQTTPESQSADPIKKMPDQMTKIKVGIPTTNINFLPWHIADQKGIFDKYNLDVEFTRVEGGVVGLRGLQTGDFAFLGGLPEPAITGVSEGANVKVIGALTNQSMYTIFVTPDIQNIEDLKGKAGAVLQPGNGTDVILRWWLKQKGLEPNKDVRIISAGGVSARVQALLTGQAQVTLLSPPTDLQAEAAGLKKIGLMRDELKSYNHDAISANGTLLKDNPEIARAFMAATAEGIAFVKDPANRSETVQIGSKVLDTKEQDFVKSLEFALPSYGDKGKVNLDGIKWAIDTAKEAGTLTKDIKVEDVVDEQYYIE
ncbi:MULTISPECIES: ABC transporter substrate-binding protein [unclassified Paenibacillus]|uniref:ABC transporter substrate-binding protein n=1 Tax=unclassified Paenibacillus TaxID=185978 RepID=UPI001AE43D6F|nr:MULTISPECIES: ABC transporter substrate-binding protein [unclassified Paenibacillus]MBP1156889.1 NitT/TauT family transport system substrate-binding protein [Paenibacillus sp. PvP091]MBP1172372.1 NitT/TauT family transport system substrate-binding protein [Paenibacillus sp. PvR098]MBP2438753.1 NitT/TauT family transport system substrate-binding protein [Paenibacillus sp. PvP052]